MKHPPGMNTYHGQEKNRVNWQRSMEKRNELVDTLRKLNINIERPHELRMSDLEILVDKHLGRSREDNHRYLSYSEIARMAGINAQTLRSRIRAGMTLEKALLIPVTEPVKLTKKQLSTAEGNGITRKMVSSRMSAGWKLNDAITLPKGTRINAVLEQRDIAQTSNVTNLDRREIRRQKQARRIALLNKINYLEEMDGCKKTIESLERELVKV